MQSSTATYIPRLDHLRFMAVLLVFGWHVLHLPGLIPFDATPEFFAFSIFEEGHTGVSLFLTLSGFIFASLCDGRDVMYWAFMRNRVLRVLPLYALWVLLTYHLMRPAPDHLLPIMFGLLNQEFPGPGWTVLVEFELYLMFPFFLRFTERYGIKYLVGVLLVAFLLRGGAWFATHSVQYIAYWTVFGRVDQFVFGMLGFRLCRRYGKVLGHPAFFLGVLTAWLLIYHWFNRLGGYYLTSSKPIGSFLWVYLPTLEGFFYAVLAASYLSLGIRGIPMLGRAAAWLGSASYSIYLSHIVVTQGVFSTATSLGLRLNTPLRVVLFAYLIVLPVVVAFSALTYYVVELPFLRLREPYFRDRSPGGGRG